MVNILAETEIGGSLQWICKIMLTVQVTLQWKVWVMTMLLQHTACSFQGRCCIFLHYWPKRSSGSEAIRMVLCGHSIS